MNSGDLISKYSGQQTMQAPSKLPNQENYTYYCQNNFKRFMGYKEPDYLTVSGFYASLESSYKSKPYNNFLVKKADYVAKMLKWYDDDGVADTKRAENAIRSACRKKASNGLFYMYIVSNRNKCLSEKGGNSIYMSGMRYKRLLEESSERKTMHKDISSQTHQNFDISGSENDSDLDRVRMMVRELADCYGFSGYEEGAVVWVSKRLLEKLSISEIQFYFNQITSTIYCRQAAYNNNCPQINGIFDIFHKYDKIQRFLANKKRHIVTPD